MISEKTAQHQGNNTVIQSSSNISALPVLNYNDIYGLHSASVTNESSSPIPKDQTRIFSGTSTSLSQNSEYTELQAVNPQISHHPSGNYFVKLSE